MLKDNGFSENVGTINAAPNHPADKLENISEATDNICGLIFFTQPLYQTKNKICP